MSKDYYYKLTYDTKHPKCPWCHGAGHVQAIRPDGSSVEVPCICENEPMRFYALPIDKSMWIGDGTTGEGFLRTGSQYDYISPCKLDEPTTAFGLFWGVFTSKEKAKEAFDNWNENNYFIWDDEEMETH